MKLLKVSLQTHLKTLIPRTTCKYPQPLHFLRTSSLTTVHLCGPFSAREKNIRALWLTFLLRSILGDGGGMETSEGLYFQHTHRCQSIIWGCLRQEFIGSAGARTGTQVCFSADIITTVLQK